MFVLFIFKTSSVIYIIYIEQYAQSWYPRNLYLYVILKKQRANRKPNCSVKRYFSYKRSRRLNQLSPILWATGQCGQVRDTRRRGGRSNAHYSGNSFPRGRKSQRTHWRLSNREAQRMPTPLRRALTALTTRRWLRSRGLKRRGQASLRSPLGSQAQHTV